MVSVKFNPKKYELEIKGHANQNKKGKDIVCSAISTLFYTLVSTLVNAREMMEEDVEYGIKDGEGIVRCKPKAEFEGNVSLIYLTILNGYDLLAEEYPQFVKFL